MLSFGKCDNYFILIDPHDYYYLFISKLYIKQILKLDYIIKILYAKNLVIYNSFFNKLMICDFMDKEKLTTEMMLHDRKQILNDVKINPKYKDQTEYKDNPTKIIADFTEYSPLHNGHLHCMKEAQKANPHALFVAVVPGPTERSGRGLPFIMTRHARAKAAINAGADIVIEGPPMGIMGSGQYSLCLAKTFQAVDADVIPRGYKPHDGFQKIMDRIKIGHGVAPKPYKMVDMVTKEVILKGKLEEDNYVIASLSKSLTKIGFDFKNKFQ